MAWYIVGWRQPKWRASTFNKCHGNQCVYNRNFPFSPTGKTLYMFVLFPLPESRNKKTAYLYVDDLVCLIGICMYSNKYPGFFLYTIQIPRTTTMWLRIMYYSIQYTVGGVEHFMFMLFLSFVYIYTKEGLAYELQLDIQNGNGFCSISMNILLTCSML